MADAGSGWTDERVSLLGRLWGEGLSASQIAGQLGGGVTRNAVIGKVHRLGLSGRGKTGQPAATSPRVAKTRAVEAPRLAVPNVADAERPARPPAVAVDTSVEIPVSRRVSIMELRESMCRWPLGDPTSADFGFCGARAVTGVPYCAHHCQIAYQPAAERRRLRA